MPAKDMLDDLKRSGLTPAQIKQAKFKHVAASQVKTLLKVDAEAYAIPYFDLSGKPSGYTRYRILKDVPISRKILGKVTKQLPDNNLPKYLQAKNTTPEAYFPNCLDWQSISKDPNKLIVITEGEKKALVSSLNGLPTIGLGGVYSYRSRSKAIPFIKQLEDINWQEREVVIMYDSDFSSNEDVRQAMYMLADELNDRGAVLDLAYVPEGRNGEKQGIDDYLLQKNKTVATLLDEAIYEAYSLSRELYKMRSEVAFVHDLNAYIKLGTDRIINDRTLVYATYANRKVKAFVNDELKEFRVAKEYNEWKHRREVGKIVYMPQPADQERTLITEDNNYNRWKGWPVKPKKGNVKPWKDLLNYLFDTDTKEGKEFADWFEQWVAYPIQNPGAKLYSAVLVWSIYQGNGKSLLGEIIGSVYGDNYTKITEADLLDSRNEWAIDKQFIMADETSERDGRDKRVAADQFKYIVTNETIRVDQKYVQSYEIKNCINFYLTSNKPQALYLEKHDRRNAVWCIDKGPHPDRDKFYDPIDKWYRSNEGKQALLNYLLNDVKIKTFDPKAEAIMTQDKREMQEGSYSSVEAWAEGVVNAERIIFKNNVSQRDLFTLHELTELYNEQSSAKHVTDAAVRNALRIHGAKQYPHRTNNAYTGSSRLWVVRNIDKWLKASPKQVKKHVEDTWHMTNVVDFEARKGK